MGYLLDKNGKRRIPLRAHHTIGRSADKVDSVVAAPAVSRIHAVVEWFHEGWQIRDLSRNGTWLNGKRLTNTESEALPRGSILNFGERKGPAWELIDDSEPTSLLVGDTPDTPTLPLTPYLFLPDEALPQLVVYYSAHRRSWLYYPMSGAHEQLPEQSLEHGERIAVEGRQWRVFLADSAQSTELMPESGQRLDDYQFLFDLSLDEEITRLRLRRGEQAIDLGERSHHYLLLHLARRRAEDAARGLDQKSQGWADNELLTRELGVDPSHLNILIFRARKQIADKLVVAVDSEQLVERRKGQVRFGCPHFSIFKGERLTHEMRDAHLETAPQQ